MQFIAPLFLAALATCAGAVSVDLNKRESPLTIALTAVGNTEVNLAITNNGNKAVNLLNKGTFLDEVNPVEKVSVYSSGGSVHVPFEGIRLRLMTSGLTADDFTPLGAGETKQTIVEAAELHTLSDGGDFEIFVQGQLPYAEANSTQIAGNLQYESNKLKLHVDGTLAATAHKSLAKRTVIGNSCTGQKLTTINTALSNCQKIASAASTAAAAGTKLSTYFKSTSTSTKELVSGRLSAIADDCGSTDNATTTTNCNDPFGGCSANVLAYAVPSQNFITYCDTFFDRLPALSDRCHGQDQATTVLHEETHAPGVFSPATGDLGYGFAAASRLSAAQALNNADTFALYSNSIYLDC